MSFGVIVLAPPWPRSGSGNLIAAQSAAHARRGARVLLLLAPLGRGHARGKVDLWQDAVSAMRFGGVETVTHLQAGRGRLRSYLEWLLAGRDDAIAISARYAASGRLPAELAAFVASAPIDLIHANHVFSVPLARRIAAMVHAAQGRRPRILLETHDVQSDAFAARRQKNPHSRRVDAQADLLRTELALCAQADILVHVTRPDCDFFASRLPDKRHEVILPTLDPTSEAELVRRRGVQRQAEYDFVYVGTRHQANLETVRWLLGGGAASRTGVRKRVRIVGMIGSLRRHDPALYSAHAHLFAGEVPSVYDDYAAAKAVLAPATAGTGVSIKLVEALCTGKPVLTTSLALRGVPAGEVPGADIHVHDTAAGFADAMSRLAGVSLAAASRPPMRALVGGCSNARCFAALAETSVGLLRFEPAWPDDAARTPVESLRARV
jgi:glycosyltransferase involved in cell wall biosynthesis